MPTALETSGAKEVPNEDHPHHSDSTSRMNVDAVGERFLGNQNIVYPANVQAVVDVTQAPYHLDNTGKKDCTSGLIQAIADVLRDDREAMQVSLRNIKASDGPPIHRADELSFTDSASQSTQKTQRPLSGSSVVAGYFLTGNPLDAFSTFRTGPTGSVTRLSILTRTCRMRSEWN